MFRFLVMAAVAMIIVMPALALEKLDYNTPATPALTAYTKSSISQDIQNVTMAKADLNQDGIFEYIVRTDLCENKICSLVLIAENDGQFVTLGRFNAQAIALGPSDSGGMRQLLVYESPLNDFEYVVYSWNAAQSRYEMTPTKD